jgi:hypothetical protein
MMTGMIKTFVKQGLMALLIILSSSLLSNHVIAQSVPADSLVVERLSSIRHIIDREKTNTGRWWYGWLAGYSAATIVQTAVCLTSEDLSTRQDMALGAATTLLGAAGQFISPVKPIRDWQRISQLPEVTEAEKISKLAESEKLLQQIALNEKIGRSWKTHAVCTAVNLGTGLVTWLGFKRSVWAGLEVFAINTAITETQILSQPKRAMKEYNRYIQKYEGYPVQPSPVTMSVSVFPGGISLLVKF